MQKSPKDDIYIYPKFHPNPYPMIEELSSTDITETLINPPDDHRHTYYSYTPTTNYHPYAQPLTGELRPHTSDSE